MTQVQTMTDSELNLALADKSGYEFYTQLSPPHRIVVRRPDGSTDFFDPCTDPAASLEVQTKAIEVDAREYVRNLQELKWECSFSGISMKKAAELLTASPRERADAAYITLSSKR